MDNRLPDSGVRDYDSTGSEVEGILNFQSSRFAKAALDVTRGFAAGRLYPNKRPKLRIELSAAEQIHSKRPTNAELLANLTDFEQPTSEHR